MSSIISLFLLVTFRQKILLSNVNPLFYVNSVNDSIVVQYVSVAQVRNVIMYPKDSSPGWDHLSPFVRKQCVDTYVERITVLISNSLYHGIFPNELKLARMVPMSAIELCISNVNQ